MERIKQALEKARQERQSKRGAPPDTPGMPGRVAPSSISYGQTRTVGLDNALLKQHRIIAGLESSAYTESYNLLRTQILQRFKENHWNVLAVTSPGTGEGKTLTAINLAISIAKEVDYTVLLVDANLRHPQMLEQFGMADRKGLSDYLTNDIQLAELLVQPESIKHLVLLPGGQALANSAEMLNSPKMEQLVNEMKSRYQTRIIIFDLPPVLSSADVLAFSPYVDAALLVVEEGATRTQDLQHTVELLSTTNIIGTVLNKAETNNVRKQ